MFKYVKQDIKRYMLIEQATGISGLCDLVIFNPSLWIVMSYRFGKWIRNNFKVPVLAQMLKLITRLTHLIFSLITGIYIPFEVSIGEGFYIGHAGMLVINGKTVIGSNCNVSVGVIIGQGGRGERKGCPVIGNNVFIGVSAVVIGKITIGNNVAIGANSVVTKDVPDNAVVAGIPAKVINYQGSADFIKL